MNPFYRDYVWKDGRPVGAGVFTADEVVLQPTAYKIVSDPYRKWISIEKYKNGIFETIIYDSQQLNFSTLRQEGGTASWQKETTFEKDDQIRALIRDHNDRVILIETQFFEKGLCRECQIHSPNGILLSIHKLSYTALGDAFNGVTLYDSQNHTVMIKKYEVEARQGESVEFTKLLAETW